MVISPFGGVQLMLCTAELPEPDLSLLLPSEIVLYYFLAWPEHVTFLKRTASRQLPS